MPDSSTIHRWPTADAAFADACREFIKGCSCAPASWPQNCEDCRDAFINAVLHRAKLYELEIGAYGLPDADA